ncbi:hypothetical protein FisN_10Lh083 [Fistulifera solaris]|uniref:subtilisin n=1 Tax=Fistulifera solaris TaxID=1519565 RepID=A0A1Z5JTG7_FISSO|nr:hypothetical protein FisN_10Lh083 [Fistulifera solaris]|eukprot:GAX17229.1 hypothetical protein FisN_10Lh083 [Fistulifera solaris]
MRSIPKILSCVALTWMMMSANATSHGRFSRSRRLEGYVNVVITLKEETSVQEFIERLSFFGATLTVTFRRTHALAVTMPEELVGLLELDSQVKSLEDDAPFTSFSETIPWGVTSIQGHDSSIPPPVNTGSCFGICVIDTGLQVSHPDIPFTVGQPNIQGAEFNLNPEERWYRPAPAALHGTHVAGTIIAQMNNNMGVAGIIEDPANYCLLIARVFPDYGDVTDESMVDAALEWCVDSGAKVINLSLGGPRSNENSRAIYNSIVEEGTLVVASSGNRAGGTYIYPASYDSVLSVSAVDRNLDRPVFSVYNDQVDVCAPGVDVLSTVPKTIVYDDQGGVYEAEMLHFSSMPDADTLQAPLVVCSVDDCGDATGRVCLMERGQNSFLDKAIECQSSGGVALILYNFDDSLFSGTLGEANAVSIPVMSIPRAQGLILTGRSSVAIEFQNGGYKSLSGTSMASPHVVGVAAKIWAARPDCSNLQVREALEATALDLGSRGKDIFYGHGLVQAADAYEYLLTLPAPCGLGVGDNTDTTGGGAPDSTNFVYDQLNGSPPKKVVEEILIEGASKMAPDDSARGGLTRRRMLKGTSASSM